MTAWETQRYILVLWCMVIVSAGANTSYAGDRRPDDGAAIPLRDMNGTSVLDVQVGMSALQRKCNGGANTHAITLREWRQIYYEEVCVSRADPGWPGIRALRRDAKQCIESGVIPIAIFFSRRPIYTSTGYRDERGTGDEDDVAIEGNRETRIFAAAALRDYTHRGEEVTFIVERSWIVGDGWAGVYGIEVDFGDGRGFRAVPMGERIPVRYEHTGRRVIHLRANMHDGSSLHARCYFHVEHLQTPAPHDTIPVTATIPYNGAYATGEAYCYLADSHVSLESPIIAVEGFDIDNTMNWDELYQHLNQENLLETLRGEGYDLVVLNFTDATDYIQGNAFVLVELISHVAGEISPYRNIAVVGASMGGLVARYALAYMETQLMDHRTILLMTLDTPHRGANIPLGIQYWMDFFSEQSEDAAFLLGQLDRPAARQMLVYHHTDPPGSTGEGDSLRAVLTDAFAAVGEYPSLPRLVAIANGSGSVLDQGFAPGEQIIMYEYNSLLVDIVGNVWAVPDGTEHIIFDGLLDLFWPLPDDEMTVTVSGTKPYDCAPGGTRSSMAQMDTTDVPYGDIVALHDAHCFIPTVSALDFDTEDLFHDIAGDPDPLSHTPFDTIYYPSDNQEHVAITPENAAWIMTEIHGAITAVEPEIAVPTYRIELHQNYPNPFNPITSVTYTLHRECHAELAVYTVTGERIRTLVDRRHEAGRYTVTWDGRDERGRPAASGVYLYRLDAEGTSDARKMVLLR